MHATELLREQDIRGFIDTCLADEKGGSLYVCGSPGIGKSLLMESMLGEIKQEQGVVVLWMVFCVEENQGGAAKRNDTGEKYGCGGDGT